MATKVAPELLKDVCAEHNLTHVKTEEKNPLPSAEAIAQEKTEEELKSGIEQFDKDQLRPQKTEEKNPLPDKDDIVKEKQEQEVKKEIVSFPRSKLRRANTEEKISLPSSEAIQQEKREVNIRKSLTEFEKGNLKHVKTEEKNPLPDATDKLLLERLPASSGGDSRKPSRITHNSNGNNASSMDSVFLNVNFI